MRIQAVKQREQDGKSWRIVVDASLVGEVDEAIPVARGQGLRQGEIPAVVFPQSEDAIETQKINSSNRERKCCGNPTSLEPRCVIAFSNCRRLINTGARSTHESCFAIHAAHSLVPS